MRAVPNPETVFCFLLLTDLLDYEKLDVAASKLLKLKWFSVMLVYSCSYLSLMQVRPSSSIFRLYGLEHALHSGSSVLIASLAAPIQEWHILCDSYFNWPSIINDCYLISEEFEKDREESLRIWWILNISVRYIDFGFVAHLLSHVWLCGPMDCSTPGFLVYHCLPTHVHWVSDAIQPSHPLWPPSHPALNVSWNQGLLWWLRESFCNTGDPGWIPGLGRSPGEDSGYPLQYSCLKNSMHRFFLEHK